MAQLNTASDGLPVQPVAGFDVWGSVEVDLLAAGAASFTPRRRQKDVNRR